MGFNKEFIDRYVKYQDSAREDIARLEKEIPRFNQIHQAIYLFLKISAHRGKPTRGSLYLYSTRKQRDAPALEVYYTFDSENVTIYNICVAEEFESD